MSTPNYDTMISNFAPLVYLYSSDPIRPASPDFTLPSAQLIDPDGNPVANAGPGDLTKNNYAALLGQSFTDTSVNPAKTEVSGSSDNAASYESGYSLFWEDQTKLTSVYEPPTGSVLCGMPLNSAGECTVSCYAYVRPGTLDDGTQFYDIDYCFYYPFNGAIGVNGYFPIAFVHVGDWEHFVVRVSSDGSTVLAYYFARHNYGDGRWLTPNSDRVQYETINGVQRIVVFSALNSHASYSTPGAHANPTKIANLGLAFDYTNYGPQWQTWNYVVNIGTASAPASGYEWLQFTGRWGNTDGLWVGAEGPRTPSFQEWWRNGEATPITGNKQILVMNNSDDPTPESGSIIGVAAYPNNRQMFMLYRGWGASETIFESTYSEEKWYGNNTINAKNFSPGTKTSVAVGVFNKQLVAVYRGDDKSDLYYAIYDGDSWTGNTKISIDGNNPQTPANVSLVPFNGNLFMTFAGSSNVIHYAYFDGTNWYGNSKIVANMPDGSTSNLSVYSYANNVDNYYLTTTAMTVDTATNTLYMTYQGANNDIYLAKFDGTTWTSLGAVSISSGKNAGIAQTDTTPAIMYWRGGLSLVYTGQSSNDLRYARYDFNTTQWYGNDKLMVYGDSPSTPTAPALCVCNDLLYILYPGVGVKGKIYQSVMF